MSKFSRYVTETYVKDFLMYGVLAYEEKIPSMKRIMAYIYYYHLTGEEEFSIIDVPGLRLSEHSNGHMAVEAMERNPLLKQIILRFLTARERPDHNIVQAIRWLSDTVTADTMDPSDECNYRKAWDAWASNTGPVFTDEDPNHENEDHSNGSGTSAESSEPDEELGINGTKRPPKKEKVIAKSVAKKRMTGRKRKAGKTAAKSKPHPLAKDAGLPPSGTSIEEWQRIYNNADSQLYKLHGKNAALSREDRKSGATRQKALYFIRNGHW